MPHTWLSPPALKPYPSTASLRHVRGSPALRLLRGLCPSYETSLDLAACRSSRDRRSIRGSRVQSKNPWCFRWLAPSLAGAGQLPRRFRGNELRIHSGYTQSLNGGATEIGLHPRPRPSGFFHTGFPTPTSSCASRSALIHRGTPFGSASRTVIAHAQLRPLGFCRPSLQSATMFAAPFSVRPDSDEDDVF